MARPREFDPDEALKDAMDVFWQHGFDDASLPTLLKGMGLTRGSLYKAFVDKKTLFMQVLNRYEVEAVNPAVELLSTGSTDGLVRIKTLFSAVVEAVENGDHRGCLLCSAAAGPAAVDDEIADVVHLQLRKMRRALETALTQSAAYADTSKKERREIASLLMTQYVGLRVLARSNAPLDTLQMSANAIYSFLADPSKSGT